MVKIRLRRTGRKKQPTYRLVAAEALGPRDGRFIEILGNYNPRTHPPTLNIKTDRVNDWLSKGAQPTDSVRRLLGTAGILKVEHKSPAAKPAVEVPVEA
ncbi:MAG TPA: 30S ribosomal protein S16 [Candidatus Xenobia bacterium]|jgi:small subunit ribosomal protein S16